MRILVFVATLLCAGPAAAALTFCNEDDERQQVAIGYFEDDQWVSEGWFGIAAGECEAVIDDDLANQHYYYSVSREGEVQPGEGYRFCTASGAFTIRGDENCAERGYSETDFRPIDTGQEATSFTVILPAAAPSPSALEETAPTVEAPLEAEAAPQMHSAASDLEPGLLGEPFTITGRFEGCEESEHHRYCAFAAEGWEYYAYHGGGTPQNVYDALETVPAGWRLTFVGDIIHYNDVSVEIALRAYSVNEEEHWSDPLFALVQGSFRSFQDPKYTAIVKGSSFIEYYDGEQTGDSNFYLAETCEEANGAGPVMIRIDRPTQETMCLMILAAEADHFTTAPAGGWAETMWQRQ